MNEDAFNTVADFFARFYHEETDDDVAIIQAFRKSRGHFDYRWRIAEAFREILGAELPTGSLTNLVREHANRFCRDDGEAREFLEETYTRNSFDIALDPNDLDE